MPRKHFINVVQKSVAFSYNNPVKNPKDRSLSNVPFTTPSEALDSQFIKEAEKAGFKNIKGHLSVGGMRASIYNAFPREGVIALVNFMTQFEAQNSK
ncbi:phosphoserine aminotransferase [Streptococcus pseudoporcinus]|uniref:Phosphoserine aminotransferase n=1 Tax=Streptococcus pseudoporcinus TaxID=361101 RepID=A0A4V6L6D9_9STRE|nr:phosphoserine aminotransferase [Streptococcus pseudoporcinus]